MKEKTYFKIASIISSCIKGSYTHPWYGAYNHNRTNSMMVKIRFTRESGKAVSPCHIETLDGSMTYIVMPKFLPILPRLNRNNTKATIIELEKKKVF